MFGMETLDILIGLVTVYLTFALACTALVEALCTCLARRQYYLERALNEFFYAERHGVVRLRRFLPGCRQQGSVADEKFASEFWQHPLIFSLSRGEARPSYISPALFVEAVDDLIARIPNDQWPPVINELVKRAPGSNKPAIELQFNAVMERATGWFKRHTQILSLICAALMVLAANVDTVELINQFSVSPSARLKLAEVAQKQLANIDTTGAKIDAVAELPALGVKLGWAGFSLPQTAEQQAQTIALKICGLLVSILAISLGAPFWFDTLKRLINIRGAGAAPK